MKTSMRDCVTMVASLALLMTFAHADDETTVRSFAVGDARIDVVATVFPSATEPARVAFVSVHDDEDTVVEAAGDVLRERGGRLLELRHSGAREIGFRLGGTQHRIDPNRIFTPAGRRATLERLSAWSQPADDVVAAFADELLSTFAVDDVDLVVALHNNTPDRYTAANYAAGGPLAADAARVSLRPGGDPDDFFFVTDTAICEALADRGHSVILQNEATVTDDGSLSVWCGRMGIPYVNVEAEHGHRIEQAAMLRGLLDAVAAVRPQRAVRGVTQPPPGCELVNVHAVDPTIVIDNRYATKANVTGMRLYPANEVFLERSAAERLARVQARLRGQSLGLKVFDGYRPLAIQKALWRIKPDPRYVADPAKGSRHNRGSAVDLTLVDAAGQELPMPSEFDEFSERSHLDFTDAPGDRLGNREILQKAMQAEGFRPLPTEWWHFDAPGWRAFPVMDANPYERPLFPDEPAAESTP
ncbi:MAG: M15 family metallopeptidase [Planctomycetes bacterium]|nr:M15 family metallopeptidase [Planctomycetota bacterium]